MLLRISDRKIEKKSDSKYKNCYILKLRVIFLEAGKTFQNLVVILKAIRFYDSEFHGENSYP